MLTSCVLCLYSFWFAKKSKFIVVNDVPIKYVSNVVYLGFMFTSDSKDDVDIQKQLKT